jgi:succinylglutamic semialdehyde dehydrogenase
MRDLPILSGMGHFLGGQWHAADAALASTCPFDTRHTLGWYPADCDRVDEAVHAASSCSQKWRTLPLADRIQVLLRFAQALAKAREALAALICAEVGKPWLEALAEADLLASKIRLTCEIAPKELGPVVPDRVDGFWDYRPHGVVAVLGPFNFPMHLSNGHIVPALVAGNAVILKPSEVAPACGQAYVQLWESVAGEWAGALSLLQGGGATGAALAAHDGVHAVCFTGSWSVGVRIRQATAAQTGKLLALEMGGKNAALVFDDADLDHAADQITAAALQSTGQRCTATSRVLVQRRAADELTDKLRERFQQWRPGDPFDDDGRRLGPLATAAAQARFLAVQHQRTGIETVLPSTPVVAKTPGHWVLPAVHRVVDVAASAPRWREELFGPEVLLEVVDSDEEAVARANATEYGLAASVHTSTHSRFVNARHDLRAGIINWNRGTAGASSAMPFGGVGHSGNHRPAGVFSLRYCVWPVATLLR